VRLLGHSSHDLDEVANYAYACQFWSTDDINSSLDSPWCATRAMAIVCKVTCGIACCLLLQ
jgi:hypothetical protein